MIFSFVQRFITIRFKNLFRNHQLCFRIIFGFFLFFQIFNTANGQQLLQTQNAPRFLEKKFILPGDSLIQLQYHFIVPGSDSLRAKTKYLQPKSDYQIDYRFGKIKLIYQPSFPESLTISYRTTPINLKPSYQFLPFVLWKAQSSDSAAVQEDKLNFRKSAQLDLFDESQLRKSGSITRSISVGNNQGLRLDSGLRLQLEGKITSDVDIIAALSDQNTPIQPEGNTQSLQEIDKVYIQIKSPFLQATLGDFNVRYQAGRFGNYQRKLQGAQLSVFKGSIQTSITGAVSRGKFHTNQFKGEEGKQGPYQLRGERGETEIIVLAGTERVWIDGEVMTRGEENDYVIEYGSGQITFTRKRLVTGDSRIEVDFEYSDLKFQRNLYSANVTGNGWKNRFKFNASLIRESDDKNNPLEIDLNDEEKQLLSQIGDQVEDAFVESGNYVGDGKGNYIQIDSLGLKIYRYVGNNLGDYQVRFSYVGDQGGDYKYIGGGRYQYQGEGKGNYTPRRYLPVAQSQNLATLYTQLNPVNSFDITSEIAISHTDQNLWSTKDDNNNVGSAYQLQTSFKPKSLLIKNRQFGSLNVTGLLRESNNKFFEITRNREVEYNRKWDISESSKRGEKVQEFSGNYSPWKGVKVQADLGSIQKGSLFKSNRNLFGINLQREKLPQISFREENISRDDNQINIKGNWKRRLGQANYQIWRFRPNFRFESEDKRDRSFADSLRTGFAFEDISAGLDFQVTKPLLFSFKQTNRDDRMVSHGKFEDNSQASSQTFSAKLSQWRNLMLSFSYTTRIREFEDSEQPEKRTRLADVNVRYTPLQRAFQSDFRLQMSTTQISKTEQIYFKVEQGRGNLRYDPDLNEYIPDPFGDYVLRTFATGEFEPVNDLLLNGKLTLKPRLLWRRTKKKLNKIQNILSNFGWESFFSMNEKSRRDNPWYVNFDYDGLIFPDDETVFGRYTIRQDIYFFENVSDRSLRFRWMENYEKNNRLTEGGQYSLRQEQSIRFTTRFSKKFSSLTNLKQRRIDRIFNYVGRVNRRILSRGIDSRFSYRPKTSWEIAAEIKYQKDLDQVFSPATVTTWISVKPNFSYAFRGRGRLRGDVEFSNVTASPKDRIIPYEMANGRRVGENFRWQLGLDYRLSSKLMILFSYIGRQEPGRNEVLHLGKAEVKAFF